MKLISAFLCFALLATGSVVAQNEQQLFFMQNKTPQYSYAGVYSLRKVVPEYTGSAIKIANSGGATRDIGFDANGDLNVGEIAVFNGVTLTENAGSRNGNYNFTTTPSNAITVNYQLWTGGGSGAYEQGLYIFGNAATKGIAIYFREWSGNRIVINNGGTTVKTWVVDGIHNFDSRGANQWSDVEITVTNEQDISIKYETQTYTHSLTTPIADKGNMTGFHASTGGLSNFHKVRNWTITNNGVQITDEGTLGGHAKYSADLNVHTWYDQSGNGKHFTQTNYNLMPNLLKVSNNPPIRVVGTNNMPALYFDKTKYLIGTTSMFPFSEMAIFAYAKPENVNENSHVNSLIGNRSGFRNEGFLFMFQTWISNAPGLPSLSLEVRPGANRYEYVKGEATAVHDYTFGSYFASNAGVTTGTSDTYIPVIGGTNANPPPTVTVTHHYKGYASEIIIIGEHMPANYAAMKLIQKQKTYWGED